MDKSKTKTNFFVGFLIAILAVSPYIAGKSLAATTTLVVVTTQANVPASTIPSITFSGGSDAVPSSVPAVVFAGGAEATSDGTLPDITFTSGTNADLVSIPGITYAGGVNEIKASQTLTVNALPANNETIIIGNCTVTFVDGAGTGDNSAFAADHDCVDGIAIFSNYTRTNPGVARSAAQIAAVLRLLTNVSDNTHGALTVSGSGSNAIFTTTGTENVASNIAFTDGTSGKITSVPVTSVVGVAASATITIPAGLAANATDHLITIDGVVIDLGTDTKTPVGIADELAHTDFSTGTDYAGHPYAVTNPIGADVLFTRTSVGSADNGNSLTIADADYTATNDNPSIARFTIADALYGGDPYDHSVAIDGITIDIGSAAQTTAQIATTIKNAINANGTKDYTADVSGSTVTLTENSLGIIGNGVTLPVTDGNYTKTGPLTAAVTITISSGLSASAVDHAVTIDGIAIDLGTSALNAAGVAAAIRAGITGSGSYAGKSYTVSGSGANIIFTQKTGGVAGNGPLTIQNSDYTVTNAAAASASINIPAVLSADSADHSLEIDGVTVELGTAAKTAGEIAALIASADFSSKDYTVANPSGANLVFTKKSGGAAGNVSLAIQDADYGTMAQVVTITPENVTAGETATVTINGTSYSYLIKAGDLAADVVSGLQAVITSSDVATSGTDTLILTANVPGTAFTATSGLADPSASTTKSKNSKKSKPKPKPKRDINENFSTVKLGDTLVERGKRFSKKNYVALYFSKAEGSYYSPVMVKTDKYGSFAIQYSVNKPIGNYKWYAVDIKTGWKSKTLRYRVRQ